MATQTDGLDQTRGRAPALAPMVRWHQLATTLTQQQPVRSPQGAMYGIVMDGNRLASPALIRTPVPRLFLAGQDVAGAGVQAAAMSGLMAAAAIEPALLRQLAG